MLRTSPTTRTVISFPLIFSVCMGLIVYGSTRWLFGLLAMVAVIAASHVSITRSDDVLEVRRLWKRSELAAARSFVGFSPSAGYRLELVTTTPDLPPARTKIMKFDLGAYGFFRQRRAEHRGEQIATALGIPWAGIPVYDIQGVSVVGPSLPPTPGVN